MKRNAFLIAALEELSKDTPVTNDEGKDVSDVATTGASKDPTTTNVEVDAGTDAVAELMEKNSELADSKATLESETFDNDLDAIQTVSDSVNKDLDEAVAAGVALEQLAYLTELSIKTNQANTASNAGYFFALEQICARVDMHNVVAALEEAVPQLEGPKAQAESIGKVALEKSKEIIKKLIEGIKRIAGWVLNIVRTLFARAKQLADKAHALLGQIDAIDESKTIEGTAFISSLRLVEGGDPNKQFTEYGQMATKTLYGFFGNSFGHSIINALDELKSADVEEGSRSRVTAKLVDIIKVLMSLIYPENGTLADVPGSLPSSVNERDVTVAKSVPCIGGLQLYVAATLDATDTGAGWMCKSGPAKEQPKIDVPESIPVVKKQLARDFIGLIQHWMRDQQTIEKNFRGLQTINFSSKFNPTAQVLQQFLSVMTALATGCLPYLMRLNVQNSANFIAYVEKSIAVSKGTSAEKK
jgi:hypothetical protein